MTNLKLWKSLLRIKKRRCGRETHVHAALMDRSISTVQKLRGKQKTPQFRQKALKNKEKSAKIVTSFVWKILNSEKRWRETLWLGRLSWWTTGFLMALTCGSAWQFILALSKWNNTGNDTQQIPLKIPRAACSLLPKAQKSVLPHGNLSGLLGSFWKWFGLRQDQTRQLPSWCCHSLCLMQHKCDASREHVVVSWMRTVLIKKGYRNWDCSPGEEKVLGWPNCDLPVAEGNWLERWRGTLDRALERQDRGNAFIHIDRC